MNFKAITYHNTQITDKQTFDGLPSELKEFYREYNGLVICNGGLQFKGCINDPKWISLEDIWTGLSNLHSIYDEVLESDIPFAQDCFGDQYLWRDKQVIRLSSESGDIENLDLTFNQFLDEVIKNPTEFLALESFNQLYEMDIKLQDGQLMNVYPPFMFKCDGDRSFKPVPSEEQISFLKSIYTQTKDLPEGQSFKIVTE